MKPNHEVMLDKKLKHLLLSLHRLGSRKFIFYKACHLLLVNEWNKWIVTKIKRVDRGNCLWAKVNLRELSPTKILNKIH